MGTKFYAVQMMVDGFGHDTTTLICYPTREDCQNWIKCHAKKWEKCLGYEPVFEIVEQKFGTDFEEFWG
jgi:hypothetical protein